MAPAQVDQLLMLGEHQCHSLGSKPALPAQPASVGQVGLDGLHVPVKLVAVDGNAAVWGLERVRVARYLHPANAARDLRPECFGACAVGLALALSLVELVVQRVGHVLPARLAVRSHTPVGANARLIALDRQQRGADQVFDGRGNAKRLLPAQ